jgi:AraC family transcriptional regulator, transcriptional activator of the genes for pyochelin and ferripyochelin receptors
LEFIRTAGLSIFMEAGAAPSDGEWVSKSGAGYWFGTLLEGHVAVEQDHFGPSIWRSGDSVAFATERALNTSHRAMDRNTLSAVFMQIEPDAAEGILGLDTLDNLPMGEAQNGKLFAGIGRTITSQMMNCHLQGSARRLYITGKAMEFIAHVVDVAERRRAEGVRKHGWTSREIAQFQQAREILLARLDNPPTVAELARAVGTNSRKLGAGFNDLFGMPVYAFVKAQRLDAARVMLESGETSVAVVAHRLGYQPQHFATEFKRRFGMPPSRFAGKRN